MDTTTSQGAAPDQTTALAWRLVEDTTKLRPIAGVSGSIAYFSTLDGDVSVLNAPLFGTTLISRGGGILNLVGAAGIGIRGLYLHLGYRLPLYYKYPNVWSVDMVFGTAYNLDFRLTSTGFWGGGPFFNLELGLLRISTLVGFGVVGQYCTTSFMCNAGPGMNITLTVAYIEETTGLPSQR